MLNPEEHLEASYHIDRVRQAEPRITSDLCSVESEVDGAMMVGLEYRLKGHERLKDKIAEQIQAKPDRSIQEITDNIPDAIRYTYQFDAADYSDGYQETRQKMEDAGYTLVHSANTWDNPHYKGINTRWRTGEGTLFEVQFHTPESFAAKQQTHDLYEKIRDPSTPANEIDALESAQQKAVAGIPGVCPVNGVTGSCWV